MEDWELEDSFEKGVEKEQFYRNGYREIINVISLNSFVISVKEEYETISFTEIHK